MKTALDQVFRFSLYQHARIDLATFQVGLRGSTARRATDELT